MVENGLGVSVMPELLLSGRNYNVAALELDPPASRTIALAIPSLVNASQATRALSNHIKSWVEKNR
jgi:DNA-binding transcriptional LysR family regulator